MAQSAGGQQATVLSTSRRSGRIAAFDGLRGLAIISVVTGHLSAYLWTADGVRSVPVLRGLVGGGAVTIFFIMSGFIATRSLLRDSDNGVLDPLRFFLKRGLLVAAQVMALCVALLLIGWMDDSDDTSRQTNVNSMSHALTFTLNWFFQSNALGMRPDLGHLWFTSVQQQWYLVIPLLVLLLGGHRRILAAVAIAGAAACTAYRLAALNESTWGGLAVDSFARADGILLGLALGALASGLAVGQRRAHALAWAGLLGCLALIVTNPRFGPFAFLDWWGTLFTSAAGLLVLALSLNAPGSRLSQLLSWGPLAALGTRSLVIYIWHYPVIFLLGRHAAGWSSGVRTVIFILVVAGVTWFATNWIHRPVQRWLNTHLTKSREAAPLAASRTEGAL